MLRAGSLGRPRLARALAFGWTPAVVLVLVNAVDGADKSVLASTLSLLQDEFGFGDTLGGAIPTVDALISVAVLVPAGWMADKLLRTRLLGIVVLSWAVLTTATALAVTLWMFVAFRLVLGGANAIDNPAASSLLADFYPPSRRGVVFGLQRVAQLVGTGVGLAVGGVVGELLGWRAAFLSLVPPAVVVAALCVLLHEPRRGAMDTADEPTGDTSVGGLDRDELGRAALVGEIGPGAEADPPGASPTDSGVRAYLRVVREVIRIPTVRSLYAGLAVTMLGLQGVLFWLPSFFERVHDLGEGAAGGITGAVAIVAAVPGTLVGGYLGDRLTRRHSGARISVVAVSVTVGAGGLVASLLAPSTALSVALLGAALFVMALSIPNFPAATADVLPARRRGTGFALFTFMTALGGAFGPLLIGGASEATGSLTAAMVVAVLPAFAGAAVVARGRHTLGDDIAAARRAP